MFWIETIACYVAIGLGVWWYLRALKRHRAKPQLRTWNPFDRSEARPGEPVFGPGAWEWGWYLAGFAVTATAVHFLVVRPA